MPEVEAVKPKMVKVRVLAEQMSYTNSLGSNTRKNFMRGDILEMEGKHAISAAEGTHPEHRSKENPHQPRAAVEILGDVDVPVSAPLPNPSLDPAQIALDRENEEGRKKAEADAAAEKARLEAAGDQDEPAF